MFGQLYNLQRIYIQGAITGRNQRYALPDYMKKSHLCPPHKWNLKSQEKKNEILDAFHNGRKPRPDVVESQSGKNRMANVARVAKQKNQTKSSKAHRTQTINTKHEPKKVLLSSKLNIYYANDYEELLRP